LRHQLLDALLYENRVAEIQKPLTEALQQLQFSVGLAQQQAPPSELMAPPMASAYTSP
jgi:hypothetical protein